MTSGGRFATAAAEAEAWVGMPEPALTVEFADSSSSLALAMRAL